MGAPWVGSLSLLGLKGPLGLLGPWASWALGPLGPQGFIGPQGLMAPQGTQGSGFIDLGGGGPNLRRPSPGARMDGLLGLDAGEARISTRFALSRREARTRVP